MYKKYILFNDNGGIFPSDTPHYISLEENTEETIHAHLLVWAEKQKGHKISTTPYSTDSLFPFKNETGRCQIHNCYTCLIWCSRRKKMGLQTKFSTTST